MRRGFAIARQSPSVTEVDADDCMDSHRRVAEEWTCRQELAVRQGEACPRGNGESGQTTALRAPIRAFHGGSAPGILTETRGNGDGSPLAVSGDINFRQRRTGLRSGTGRRGRSR